MDFKEISTTNDPNELVFASSKNKEFPALLSQYYYYFVRRQNIDCKNELGQSLVLTSLRHTSINRLVNDHQLSPWIVAQYAGTSVAMIESNYGKNQVRKQAQLFISPSIVSKWDD